MTRFLKMGHRQPLFFRLLYLVDKILPMSVIEPRISGVGSERTVVLFITKMCNNYKMLSNLNLVHTVGLPIEF